MGSVVVVLCAFALAAVVTYAGDALWAFAGLYVTTLLLVPFDIVLKISDFPDITPQAAVVLGMLCGAAAAGQLRSLFPRWRWIDALPLLMVASFAMGFGLRTDLHGFFHSLTVQTMSWGLPYLYARALLRNPAGLRLVALSIAVSGSILAVLSLLEARLQIHILAQAWNAVSDHATPTRFFEALRWGYLRANGPFSHPLILATVLVAIAPFALCWGWLDRRRRLPALGAALVIALGVLSPVSRGPLLVLGATALLSCLLALRLPVFTLVLVGSLAVSPVLVKQAQEVMHSTQADLDTEGNTDSASYRAALLMIYARQFDQFGPFGNLAVIGSQYRSAWSIDNSFLYMYIVSGWIGGTVFLLFSMLTLIKAYRALLPARGRERLLRVAILASFAGMTGCIADVWLSPEVGALYLVIGALIWNQSPRDWYARSPRRRSLVPSTSSTGASVRALSRRADELEPRWPRADPAG
jgi:hypothetical protein